MKYNNTTSDGKKIYYEESFWTGKKTITINGEKLYSKSKKEVYYGEKSYIIKGNIITGVKLIGTNVIEVVPKLQTWEYILACLPLIMVFIGGAIGGFFAALFAFTSAFVMRTFKKPIVKVIFALIFVACTFAAWYYVSNILVSMLT